MIDTVPPERREWCGLIIDGNATPGRDAKESEGAFGTKGNSRHSAALSRRRAAMHYADFAWKRLQIGRYLDVKEWHS
ncbi:hypothetical protein [Sinorhizobium medicae]|uniref:hypothetical protein n=1 Tax=Sinorhizobium medicae TaxID=110321 RepID=UPI002B1BDD18|nr:hypothetical protein [Sinorhizobium medicae]WQO45898.1 hypothetical protein U8C42_02410 [Sinorhizobium medicae]